MSGSKGEIAGNVINQLKDELAKKKDAFWARKVSYTTAMRCMLHAVEDEKTRMAATRLFAADVVLDLSEHYGEELASDKLKEFTADCKEFSDKVVAALD